MVRRSEFLKFCYGFWRKIFLIRTQNKIPNQIFATWSASLIMNLKFYTLHSATYFCRDKIRKQNPNLANSKAYGNYFLKFQHRLPVDKYRATLRNFGLTTQTPRTASTPRALAIAAIRPHAAMTSHRRLGLEARPLRPLPRSPRGLKFHRHPPAALRRFRRCF